jgi:hypothetical protein
MKKTDRQRLFEPGSIEAIQKSPIRSFSERTGRLEDEQRDRKQLRGSEYFNGIGIEDMCFPD